MKAERTKVALVGPGSHARRYLLGAIAAAKDLELGAIVGGSAGEPLSEALGVPYYGAVTSLRESSDVAACIIATPPSNHFPTAAVCLELGYHVLCEKPLTTSLDDTRSLVTMASERRLVLQEGMMFIHHPQFLALRDLADRHRPTTLFARFGFPHRPEQDFRYQRQEGGALMDAGSYPVAAAEALLAEPSVRWASLRRHRNGVPTAGSAVVESPNGEIAHLDWGFGYEYSNEITTWSDVIVTAERAFSKPPEFMTQLTVRCGNEESIVETGAHDHFLLEMDYFSQRISANDAAPDRAIVRRAQLLDEILAWGTS